MNQTKTILPHTRTQDETVLGVLQNNEFVLQSLYTEVYPKVRRYILQNNGNDDQAKDTFQKAFITTWKNIKEGKLGIDEGLNVEAYLFTIAKNKWLDYLRSSSYKKTIRKGKIINLKGLEANEEDDLAVAQAEQNEMDLMQIAFKNLGEKCKVLLHLFYFDRKSMDEISTELKIGSASARNQKYRCMEKLRGLTLELKKNG